MERPQGKSKAQSLRRRKRRRAVRAGAKSEDAPKNSRHGPSVFDLVRAYHPAWIIAKDKTRPHTKYAALELIKVAGRKPAADLTSTDVAEVCEAWRSYSLGTRYARTNALKRILRWLSEEHAAPRLYNTLPKAEIPEPRNVTATDREREALLAAAPPHMRCWLLLCSDLAMRSGTAAIIAPRHYDVERRTLTFRTKKGREMCLPVTDELDAILAPLAGLDGDVPFVCHLHPWGHIGPNNLRTSMWRIRKKLSLSRRFTPHDLRRTTAVRVYDQTHDLRVVQAVLGHRHLNSTFHYLDHRNTKVQQSVLETARLRPTKDVTGQNLAKLNSGTETIQ